MAVLKRKTWMVDSQPPPPEYQGPQAIIGYLTNYVTGTCISNSRLIDQSHGQVSIRVKDYKAVQVKQVSFEGEELVRRFVLHILPRGLRRMRYAGLYTPAGLGKRLQLARLLIARQRNRVVPECDVENVESKSESSVDNKANQLIALEGDRDEDSLEEIGFDEDRERKGDGGIFGVAFPLYSVLGVDHATTKTSRCSRCHLPRHQSRQLSPIDFLEA